MGTFNGANSTTTPANEQSSSTIYTTQVRDRGGGRGGAQPMAMLLNLGGSKKVHAMTWASRFQRFNDGESLMRARVACVKQLVWKLRSQWRLMMRPRQGRARFGYDPVSYSQNFDDGQFQ